MIRSRLRNQLYLIFAIPGPLFDLEHQLTMPLLQVVIVGPVFGVEVVVGEHGGDGHGQVVQHLAQFHVLHIVLCCRQLLHLRYKNC